MTNGRDVLPGVDGRTLIARRYHDIQVALVIDQGGADRISEARLQLIRRFSAAACIAEDLEAKLARGEEIDISEHALLVSTMVRVANKIGIDRVAKPVKDLDMHLAEKARARALQTLSPVEVEAAT